MSMCQWQRDDGETQMADVTEAGMQKRGSMRDERGLRGVAWGSRTERAEGAQEDLGLPGLMP